MIEIKDLKIGMGVWLNKTEKRGWKVFVDEILDKQFVMVFDQIDPSQKFKVEIKKLSI